MRTLITGIMIFGLAVPVLAQDRGGDERAIRTRIALLEGSINERNADAYAELFASDGDLLLGDVPSLDGRVAEGRSAIRETVERIWAGSPTQQGVSTTLTPSRIGLLQTDIAIVDTEARTGATQVQGTSVMVKRNGEWLIAALRTWPHPS